MNVFTTLWRRLQALGQSRDVKREIDEELSFHLEQRTAENIAAGMSPEEAAREARRRFGNVQSVREEMRELRGVAWLDVLAQDTRFGFRILIKQPFALASAIVALALGIGLVALMFCMVNGLMLNKLPLPEGERLAATSVPAWAFEWISTNQTSFEGMVSFGSFHGRFRALGATTSRSLCFTMVNLFEVLRAPAPVLGRGFRPGEDRDGAEPVALISFDLWQEEFHGSPSALGSTIWIEGKPKTVVGVMPRDFHFPINDYVWVAAPVTQKIANEEQGFVFGRLKPGVSYSKAEAELETFWAALNPPPKPGERGLEKIRVGPYIKGVTGALTQPDYAGIGALAAMLATLLVLFLACTNVALLTLSRGIKRIREFAVRSALGATRRRLVLQMLVENLALAIAGAICGTLAAAWIKNLLIAQMPADTSVYRGYASWWRFDMDWRVFMFVAGLTFLVNLAAGLWPALEVTKKEVSDMLKEQGLGSPGFKLGGLQRFLIVSQVAASVIILVGAIALLEHGRRLNDAHLPFDARTMVTANVQVPDTAVTNRFFEEVLTRIADLPGVKAVTLASGGFAFQHNVTRIEIEGQSYPRPEDQPLIAKRVVAFNFFATVNIAFLQGRGFVEDDRDTSPAVAVINATFARRYLPSGNPLGKRFRDSMDGRWLTVVGCVSDALTYGKDGREAVFYLPLSQNPCARMTALVLGNSESSWKKGLLAEIARTEPDQPLPEIANVQQELDGVDSGQRHETLLLEICGGASLFLSALGVFGLISFSVSQRTREIGIRMALGATRGRVVWTMLRQFVIQIGIGLGIGAVMALGLVRVFSSVLPATATKPSVFLEVMLLLGVASLAAVLGPARRASRIDPMAALRYE
jgi:putative ABC transport system permease protein